MKVKQLVSKEKHTCHAERVGDSVIYTCSQCNYRRKHNLVTGENVVTQKGPDCILHCGQYVPPELIMPDNLTGAGGYKN